MTRAGVERAPIAERAVVRPALVVVPIERGASAGRALAVARGWAGTFGAELLVVSVEGEHDGSDLFSGSADGALDTNWLAVPNRDALVTAVLEATAQHDASAVCVATGARAPTPGDDDDEIARQIVRRANVPVLLVGPHCRVDAFDGPAVLAHDGSRRAYAAIPAVRVWAEALGVRPIVLHVQTSATGESRDVMSTLGASCAALRGASLELVRGTFAAGEIREFVHEVDASLLALGVTDPSATDSVWLGRTARWLVREGPCPVLIVRPLAASTT